MDLSLSQNDINILQFFGDLNIIISRAISGYVYIVNYLKAYQDLLSFIIGLSNVINVTSRIFLSSNSRTYSKGF